MLGWLTSRSNRVFRRAAKSVCVTGGCIASLANLIRRPTTFLGRDLARAFLTRSGLILFSEGIIHWRIFIWFNGISFVKILFMGVQILRDSSQRIIGYIETKPDGSQIGRDAAQRIRGYFDPKGNATKDANQQIVGYGNVLASLITDR